MKKTLLFLHTLFFLQCHYCIWRPLHFSSSMKCFSWLCFDFSLLLETSWEGVGRGEEHKWVLPSLLWICSGNTAATCKSDSACWDKFQIMESPGAGFLPLILQLPSSHSTLIQHWFSNLVLLLISIADDIAAGSTTHLQRSWALIRLPSWMPGSSLCWGSAEALWVCKIMPGVSSSSYIPTLPGGFLCLVCLRLYLDQE